MLAANEIKNVYGLLENTFPRAELRSLNDIKRTVEGEWGAVFVTYDWDDVEHGEGEPAGVCSFMTGNNGWALMDYLAVDPRLRCKGLGKVFMENVLVELEKYLGDGIRVIIEVEDPEIAPDKEMAERRIGFYERNGFVMSNVCSELMKVKYNIMVYSGGKFAGTEIPTDELQKEYRLIYTRLYPQFVFDRIAKMWTE